MAERPRRPSSELGSETSSPTPPKRRRKSGERGSELVEESDPASSSSGITSIREGLQETESEELETPERGTESAEEERRSPSTERLRLETTEQTEPSPSKEPEEIPQVPSQESSSATTSTGEGEVEERSLSSSESLQRLTSPERTAGPSTSRDSGRVPTTVDPSVPQVSGTATMDQVAGESLTIQASILREHVQYQELSLIGNGAYGTVYKAKDLTSGQVVALKKVRVPITGDGLPPSTLREIAALKQLDRYEHPHIVTLLDVCQGPYLTLPPGDERTETASRGLMLWLVFEHVERDLASFMSSCPPPGIPGDTIRQMSKEILLGVDFLHTHRIVHRDLKPQNLLVTSQGRIKIADFGLAKTYDFEMRLTTVVVTLWYRAPEVLLGCAYATPVDIWSVGCILAELCRLEPLFPGTSEGDQLDRIFQVIGTPPQQEWPEDVSLGWTAFPHRQPTPLRSIVPDLPDSGLDLIQRILTFNPHSRLTASQALAHPYFTEENS